MNVREGARVAEEFFDLFLFNSVHHHCLPPSSHKLNKWVTKRRDLASKGELSATEIEEVIDFPYSCYSQLTQIGMVWDFNTLDMFNKTWEEVLLNKCSQLAIRFFTFFPLQIAISRIGE